MSTPAFTPSPQCWHPHPMLHDFTDHVLVMARTIGADFKGPDQDWMPVAFFMSLNAENVPSVDVIGYDGRFMQDGETKGLLAASLRAYVEKRIADGWRVIAGAFICSAWHMGFKGISPEEVAAIARKGIADQPDKTECVMFQLSTLKTMTLINAGITRDGFSPPRLGDWECMVHAGSEHSGAWRFMAAFQDLLAPMPAPEEVGL